MQGMKGSGGLIRGGGVCMARACAAADEAVLVVDASYLNCVRERTRAAEHVSAAVPMKMEMVVARTASLLGARFVRLVWVDKRGMHDAQFLGRVEGAGFEMIYREDNEQVGGHAYTWKH